MSDSFETPWTVACRAPLFMDLTRQEYWSGLPFPSPGGLPNRGIEPRSPALQADASTSEPSQTMGRLFVTYICNKRLISNLRSQILFCIYPAYFLFLSCKSNFSSDNSHVKCFYSLSLFTNLFWCFALLNYLLSL